MKIVFIVPQLTDGGAERASIVFANTFVKLGEEVHIVCLHDRAADYAVHESVNRHVLRDVSHVPTRVLRKLCKAFALASQLRRLSGDVLIPFCLTERYYIWFWLTARFSKTRLLYTVRNSRRDGGGSEKGSITGMLARLLADGIWVQTGEQRGLFPGCLQGKIFEVPNILDSRFLDIPRAERTKICHFISVGRLHPQKNQKLLIEAFARMLARSGDPDATLTIYGKAPAGGQETEAALRELIRRHHLEERVFLPGRVTDIEAKYREADAFVFGSDYEGCPNALMEAMAAGLPCVSTDCPTGPSMIIESGKNGVLVPVGDVEAMARAMEYLVKNPQAANALGTAAKRRMAAWGSAEELAGQLLTHLKRICS